MKSPQSSAASWIRFLIMNSSLIKASQTASQCALGKTPTNCLHMSMCWGQSHFPRARGGRRDGKHFSSEFPCLLCTVTGQDTASDSVLTPDNDFYCHAQEFASKDSEIGICNAFLKHSLPSLLFTAVAAVTHPFTWHNTLSSQMLCTIS